MDLPNVNQNYKTYYSVNSNEMVTHCQAKVRAEVGGFTGLTVLVQVLNPGLGE